MDDQQESRWRPTRKQILGTVGIVAVFTVAILIGYRYDITLWDWIKLLIVPAAIAGVWFNQQQREREQNIAQQRAQDEALQAYLDQIGDLLLDKERPLRDSKEGDEVRTLARARTLTVLARLDGARKGSLIQFLYESGLITRDTDIVDLKGANLSGDNLSGANLFETKLRETDLRGADLSNTTLNHADLIMANLSGANLSNATLNQADLFQANLSGANLSEAYLFKADLFQANLSQAKLIGAHMTEAKLFETKLIGTDLRGADLIMANLTGAELGGADLGGALLHMATLRDARGWTSDQLSSAASLEGATMPDGQILKMPDDLILKSDDNPDGPTLQEWLKEKEGRREVGENSP